MSIRGCANSGVGPLVTAGAPAVHAPTLTPHLLFFQMATPFTPPNAPNAPAPHGVCPGKPHAAGHGLALGTPHISVQRLPFFPPTFPERPPASPPIFFLAGQLSILETRTSHTHDMSRSLNGTHDGRQGKAREGLQMATTYLTQVFPLPHPPSQMQKQHSHL